MTASSVIVYGVPSLATSHSISPWTKSGNNFRLFRNGFGLLRTTFNCGENECSGNGNRHYLRAIHWEIRNKSVVRCSQGVMEAADGSKTDGKDIVHNLIIVGAGIAGLAAAAAMHRIGVKSIVLEQSPEIRTTGSSLTLWKNAWRVLDQLGIANDLRAKYQRISGVRFYDTKEKLLKSFEFAECPDGPHEVCGVERNLLVKALASVPPEGTIRFSSRVVSVRQLPQDGPYQLELSDGSILRTRVLLGADGVNSVVGKWMGLSQPRFVGQIGIRGVAEYPDSHPYGDKVLQILGAGTRGGIAPISANKVYWFVVTNRRNQGPKITDPKLVKAEMLSLIDGWPLHMDELLNNTPLESLSRAALSDRWNIPGITPPVVQKGVTLAGDALHPMTPNLGQGGCTALEDAVILAQTLGVVLAQDGKDDNVSINKALEEYAAERHQRTFPLTIKSFVFGSLLQIGFLPVCFVRDNIALPLVVGPSSFMGHTQYNCGELPTQMVK